MQLTNDKLRKFHPGMKIRTVDGRNPAPVDMVISHHLDDFLHPRWCRISSINSISYLKLGDVPPGHVGFQGTPVHILVAAVDI